MKFKSIFAILLVFGLMGFTYPGDLRKVNNDSFQAGEYLEYRVHYGWINAGIATLQVKPSPVTKNGRKCYHIIGEGISHPAFDQIYRVRDKYETLLDVESLIPWQFKRKIEEGDFKSYTEVEFDHYTHKAVERKNEDQHTTTYEVPENIQDVLSAFYFARTQDYTNAKEGDIFKFQNFIDQQVFDLDVQFLGREVLKVNKIKYKTVKLKPLVREGGLFKHEGDMFLWITEDENRIPVRIEAGLIVGAIQVDLQKAEGLKHPLKARVR